MGNISPSYVNGLESYISELRKENAELRTKLDAWENQEPDAYFDVQGRGFYWAKENRFINVPVITKVMPIPLFTKPKETDNV